MGGIVRGDYVESTDVMVPDQGTVTKKPEQVEAAPKKEETKEQPKSEEG
jgi:hypothetical protein